MTIYSSMRLGEIMMHQIIRNHDRDDGDPFECSLTDTVVELSPEERGYLTRRIVASLMNQALPIVREPSIETDVPSVVLQVWAGVRELIDASQDLALALAGGQPGSASDGLLLVAEATLGSEELLVVAKVEHQEAIRLEPTTDADGRRSFAVELIRDLVFGDKTRIYKIAVFSKSLSAQGVLSGEAVDEQAASGIAAYFLGRFLGMRLREDPSVLTENFMTAMTRAINQSAMSDEQKLEVHSAMVTELKSNDRRLDPQDFIRRYVPDGFGGEVARAATAAGATLIGFTKDVSRVSSHLARVRVELENNVTLVAPPDEFAQGGSIQYDDKESTLTIRHTALRNVKSGAR